MKTQKYCGLWICETCGTPTLDFACTACHEGLPIFINLPYGIVYIYQEQPHMNPAIPPITPITLTPAPKGTIVIHHEEPT